MIRTSYLRFLLKTVAGAICALSICSCAGESHSFSTAAEFKASDEYERWGPDVVPDGAEKIETWHDVESSLLRAEFTYHGPRPIRSSDMKPLAQGLKAAAVESYPALGEGKDIVAIQYRCDRTTIRPDPESKESMTYSEVEFVGDTGIKVYYWNTQVGATYDLICNSPENGSAS